MFCRCEDFSRPVEQAFQPATLTFVSTLGGISRWLRQHWEPRQGRMACDGACRWSKIRDPLAAGRPVRGKLRNHPRIDCVRRLRPRAHPHGNRRPERLRKVHAHPILRIRGPRPAAGSRCCGGGTGDRFLSPVFGRQRQATKGDGLPHLTCKVPLFMRACISPPGETS